MLTKKFIIIFGPPAVGKMTVGYELSKITGLKLFHNHLTIDLVTQFFEHESPQFKLNEEFRFRIFEEVALSHLDGLIFTFVWDLNSARDQDFIDKSCAIFSERNADIYFVELYADVSERLKRNKTEFRLSKKRLKRDIEHSEELLLRDEQHVMNTNHDFVYPDRHLKIDNTHLSAIEAAQLITAHFKFSKNNV